MTLQSYLRKVPPLHEQRIEEVFSYIKQHHPDCNIKFYTTKCRCFPVIFPDIHTCFGMASRNGYISIYLSHPVLFRKLCERLPNGLYSKGCVHLSDKAALPELHDLLNDLFIV